MCWKFLWNTKIRVILYKRKKYNNIEELEKDIIEYIDYYNNKRINGKLKGMSPVNYRIHSLSIAWYKLN